MRRVRVIPVILLQGQRMVKTRKFHSPKYVGDPINALKIFNEKEIDEVVILDIEASARKGPDFVYISKLVGECFMPLSYGGGIDSFETARQLFEIGVEKVVLGAAAIESPEIIRQISTTYGAQSTVVCIDVKRNFLTKNSTYIKNGRMSTRMNPVQLIRNVESLGAGEVILQSIDRDGTETGYDLALIKSVSDAVDIPVIALGGAASIEDFFLAVGQGASAVSAGSMFVIKGPHQAVLINYPNLQDLTSQFYNRL